MQPEQLTPHFFTVDVEEYFQVAALESAVARKDWASYPSRVANSVLQLIELLAKHEARGTFFVLGWLARHRPEVVRSIKDAGHEVASHGYAHQRVTDLRRDEFRRDVRDSKALLEDVSGGPVLGYRAPSFSIVPGVEWALEILVEEGYRYDSSLFPVRRNGYGYPSSLHFPYRIHLGSGDLVECPLATTRIFRYSVPAAGGGYLRHFPFAIIRRAFLEATAAKRSATFYIHPWELDPDQPRLPVSQLNRIRHYRGLSQALGRVDRMVSEFRFDAIAPHLASVCEAIPSVAGAA